MEDIRDCLVTKGGKVLGYEVIVSDVKVVDDILKNIENTLEDVRSMVRFMHDMAVADAVLEDSHDG